MLPISIFTPIHKGRRTVDQDSRTRTERNASNEIFSSANDKTDSEVNNEDLLTSEEEDPLVDSVPFSNRGGGLASQQTKSDEGSENQAVNSKRLSRAALDNKFNTLRPPLITPRLSQRTSGTGARQRHLAVLAAIMHRCLLQYDYIRAARAWSMILRSELDGHSVDLRHCCRYGLGAEFLLQRPNQISLPRGLSSDVVGPDPHALGSSDEYCEPAQVDTLKGYYDRLSLQYPYQKSFPDAMGPLNFRSAMFSLWIYACTNRTDLRANIRAAMRENDEENIQISTYDALQRAREISEELVELISSPPYSDSENFKKLKAMVDEWTADLESAHEEISRPHAPDITSEESNMEE